MKQFFTRVGWLGALLLGAGQLASAQTVYTAKVVTGYTADVIANGAGTVASSTNNAVDRGNASFRWCFTDSTYVNPSGQRPVRALPNSGLIRSISTTGLRFQMAPSNQNNSLRIDGAGSGTLTLADPAVATEVVVLATEGNGSTSPKTFLITFTDGTTQQITGIQVPDWYATTGATPAYIVGSRASLVTNAFENDLVNPRLFEVHVPLTLLNYGKLVQRITISKTSTDPVLNVMGVTLGVNCLGVPVGGTALASPASVCPGQPVQLSLTGNTTAGPITYQWQSAPVGSTTFTSIAGATAVTYTANPTVPTQYRALVICSQQSAPSTPVTVTTATVAGVLAYVAAGAGTSFCPSGTLAVLTATPAGGTFSSAAGLSINSTTGTLNLGASTPGTYTVTYSPPSTSCSQPVTTSLTVISPVPAVLAYPGTSFCPLGTQAVQTATPAGGTFSSSAAGLVVNSTTGTLNLAASTPGTYTVTYTPAAATPANGCARPTTTSVTVLPLSTVALAYNGSEFCKSGSSPVPSVAVPAGGVFSGSAGLVLNANTGAIDLTSTPTGTYTVTYTSGQCTNQATARLTVKGNLPPVYPNVLTPDGDGKNDKLRLRIADVSGYTIQVFNRWGRKVYEGTNASDGWDAADNSAGMYYYLVRYTDCAGQPQESKTWIEVIK